MKYGRLVTENGRKELWMQFSEVESPDLVKDYRVVTWTVGNCNLVISVPHGGTLGSDTSPAGNLVCESGHILETRKGTMAHPIKTYARDAATDVIASDMKNILSKDGLIPHIVECHVHRSKVECNRDMSEIAVQHLGKEGEFIHSVYHGWISEAIEMGKTSGAVPGVLLVDLHGHGHTHDYIELGFRLKAELLNEISNEKVESRDWRSIVTSSAKHDFTMRHLLKRRFGTNNESVKEALIGDASFSGCISRQLAKLDILSDVQCLPSMQRPYPGRLGYYTGGHTVRQHCKAKRVDSVQVELPISVRTQTDEKREAATLALARGIQDFHKLHYNEFGAAATNGSVVSRETELSDSEEETSIQIKENPVSPAPQQLPRPPSPPPPPPAIGPAPVSQDGIGHMTLMAKSRMHAELVKKATLKSRAFSSNSEPEVIQPENPPTVTKLQAPPPDLPPEPPSPAPPPPPPPPPPASSTLSPDLSDGISHMTAMSKSMMHEELKSKANSRKIPVTTLEPEPDKKALERKKIVHDLIEKNEPCSSLRKLNEQRRMEFFSQEASTNLHEENESIEESPKQPIEEDKVKQKQEPVKPIAEKNEIIVKENITKKEEKTPEINSKKSCTIL